MDALSSMMTSFTGNSGANPLLSLLQLGSGALGTVGNIQGDVSRNQVLNQQKNLTNKYANLTPAQVTAGISGLEQPLSSGLTSGVGNLVSGQLAERGLSQAPGIQASSLAQALAPFQQQEQQMATNAYFQQLGLPISSRPSPFGPFPQQTNTSSTWQSLFTPQNPSYASTYGQPYGSMGSVGPAMNPTLQQLMGSLPMGNSGAGSPGSDWISQLQLLQQPQGGAGLTGSPDLSSVGSF